MIISHIGNKPTERGRFLTKFLVDDGCWEWQAGKLPGSGYGQFSLGKARDGKRQMSAHRFAYEMFSGDIPEDMVVMHSCDNPGCVNPSHLSLGTQSDNCQDRDDKKRGVHSSKTECKNGHPFDDENTGFRANGYRYCKTCTYAWNAAARLARQAENPSSGGQAAKTHCPHGHPYDEVNTYNWGGSRHCKTCASERSKAQYQRRVRQAKEKEL